ncbi:MAG TPA: outer membrane beta-barrel family protein, partial [Salinimicrobium sp.]|nr:outer membrane beta-barrel family protein [Salinimicrobium sp.]
FKGTITSESGNFLFEDVEKKEYVLQISFVGYKSYLERINVSGNKDVGAIVLEENIANLEEVSITVKNPSIRREVDRLVFEVENTTLSTGNSWQILQKTPGVIETGGNLQVRNQSVQVYINDRKVQLSASELRTLLQNYSGENIKSVEVITNPPAKYDAEGGAILNIVTSKSISPGYKGSVNASYTQAVYPKFSFGTSHYKKTEKLNLFFNYSFNPAKKFKEDLGYINFINEQGEIFSRWNTDFERITHVQSHNANLILDYELDDRNTLSFSSYTVFSPDKTFDNEVLTNITDDLPETADFFTTRSNLEEDLSNLAFNLEYSHKLKKEGAEISVKGHYTRYDQDRFQEVSTRYFTSLLESPMVNNFFTEAQQGINIYTSQVDFVSPWGSTNFEMGAKASVIESESGIGFFDVQNGTSSPNPALSDAFLYDEHIYAAYASLAKDWEKWSLKVGLRGEYTDREGDSRSMETVESREYFDLFPTFYLLHRINENNSISFDYSRRIQRPNYADLNPFRYFLNENNFTAGNPNLEAAISNNFNLSYTLKNAYFFSVYYRDNGGFPQTLSFQDNENLTLRRVPVNMLESTSYGLDITHGRSLTGFWYTYAYISLFHEEGTFLAIESNNARVTNEVDGVYASWYNSLTLSKDGTFSGELSLLYVSDWMAGSYQFEPWTTLSLGLRKTLWNNRAEASIHFEDVLNTTNTRLTSQYLNQNNSYLPQPESRYVRIGFKYNFGNFRLSDNQRAMNEAERERL